MKKVTAFIGSNRKGSTYTAVRQFEQKIRSHADIDFEIVFLQDYQMEYCRGCKLCFDRGEDRCPVRGDRDQLIAKIDESDGIIFAAPNYAFQVPAVMKNALDHLAFIFHRPRFFGKTYTTIVTQGFFGGRPIARYLADMGQNLGFTPVGGCILPTAPEPLSGAILKRNERGIDRAAARFLRMLKRPHAPVPSLFRLMIFRISRNRLQHMGPAYFDYLYYQEQGWFASDYYYETALGPFKKLAGRLFDLLGRWMARLA